VRSVAYGLSVIGRCTDGSSSSATCSPIRSQASRWRAPRRRRRWTRAEGSLPTSGNWYVRRRSAGVRDLPSHLHRHPPWNRPVRPHPRRRADLRPDPLREQRASLVRAAAIAPWPIAGFRAQAR